MFVFTDERVPQEHKRIATNKKLFQGVKRRMLKRLSNYGSSRSKIRKELQVS